MIINKNIKIILLSLAVIVCLVVVNFIQSNYTILIINTSLIYAMTAYGLSVMLGMGGQLVFSGIAFMGIGAYFVANFCSGRLPFTLSPVFAVVLSVLGTSIIALGVGALFLRLKSSFCTFATLAFVQVLNSIFQNYEPAFGGPKGIPNISKFSFMGITFTSYKEWFYLLFILIIVLGIIVERIRRTKLGRSLASIRDNEIAAQTLGVNIYKTRVISFIISGALAGLSGSLLAFHTGFVSADLFTFTKSSTLVVMSMLGGINSTIGIIVGALLVTFLPEALRGLDNYLMMIYGFIVIIMMIFMPMGIGGIASDWARSMRRKRVLSANSGREEKP